MPNIQIFKAMKHSEIHVEQKSIFSVRNGMEMWQKSSQTSRI